MIYLDNAATSYPKPEIVYNEIFRCMKEYCANPGRGGHFMSVKAGRAVQEAREIISAFFNIDNPMQLCFTKNATEAINIAIKGILKPGDHAVISSMEHNSVVRPLKTLEKDNGVRISIIKGNEAGEIDVNEISGNIKRNTKLFVCTISSNVNGILMPISEIGKITRELDIAFLVDASQGAGTIDIDVQKMNIDMLAFPGHKALLGPQGTGGLYIKQGLKINPIMQGGTGSNSEYLYQPDFMPDIMESGTLNMPGIVGLGAAIRFIGEIGLEKIRLHKHLLSKRLYEGIIENKKFKIYSKNNMGRNSGITAFNIDGADSTEISYKLDKEYGIATRAGFHCAPLAHQTLGTVKTGIVRISTGFFNTIDEIDCTLNALKKIAEKNNL